MKKNILKILLLLAFFAVSERAHAGIYSGYGMTPGSFQIGNIDSGTLTSTNINAALVKDTSGVMVGVLFRSPVSQTNASLNFYSYCTAATGSATNSDAKVYPGPSGADDPQRPPAGASEIATSANVNASVCSAAQWLDYPFSSVTLVRGRVYFVGIRNTTATPASNNFSIATRGTMDTNGSFEAYAFNNFTTSDGFNSDPSANTSIMFPGALKFGDGTVIGNPWVGTFNHANNANDRGIRFSLTGPASFVGANMNVSDTASLIATTSLFSGSTLIDEVAIDRYNVQNNVFAAFGSVALSANTPYDLIVRYPGNDNSGSLRSIGNNPPPEILALNMWPYVDGTAGSFTASSTATMVLTSYFDVITPQSGGGTNILGNVIQ